MKLLITLLIFMAATNNNLSLSDKEEKFKIYCFDNNAFEYKLSTYEYDSTWINFMKSADLKKATLVLSDSEIENYNWGNQELEITNSGFEKLEEFKRSNKSLSHLKFIVTFDDKRIYSGEFLSFMSAMAINHPVIHYDIERLSGKKNILRIYPIHTIRSIAELPLEIRDRTAIEDVRSYFKSIGKLK